MAKMAIISILRIVIVQYFIKYDIDRKASLNFQIVCPIKSFPKKYCFPKIFSTKISQLVREIFKWLKVWISRDKKSA